MRNGSLNVAAGARHGEVRASAGRYWLAKHTHLCVSHGHVVMLDLRRDKYLAVASPEELAPWVAGWPVAAGSLRDVPPAHAGLGIPSDLPIPSSLSKLLRDGLVTSDPHSGKEAEPVTVPPPKAAYVNFQFGTRPSVSSIHAMAIGTAWLRARIARRRLSMQGLVDSVRERKARVPHRPWDAQRVRDLVTAFLWWRPLYYSSRGACLLDSLVLLELLAQHHLFPAWIYGVKLAPFGAHCWIQHDDMVLNDTPEHAASYTPIMCV